MQGSVNDLKAQLRNMEDKLAGRDSGVRGSHEIVRASGGSAHSSGSVEVDESLMKKIKAVAESQNRSLEMMKGLIDEKEEMAERLRQYEEKEIQEEVHYSQDRGGGVASSSRSRGGSIKSSRNDNGGGSGGGAPSPLPSELSDSEEENDFSRDNNNDRPPRANKSNNKNDFRLNLNASSDANGDDGDGERRAPLWGNSPDDKKKKVSH